MVLGAVAIGAIVLVLRYRAGASQRGTTASREAAAQDRPVVLLPDGGRGYMSKVFNDAWMSSYGFLRSRLDGSMEQATVGDVLRGKSGELPDLVHTHPSETVRDAIGIPEPELQRQWRAWVRKQSGG